MVVAGVALGEFFSFFDKDTPYETLKEVIRMDRAIQKANERMEFVSQDKESLRQYHMREMAMSDWASGLKLARSEGISEGFEEVAKKSLKEGLPISLIAKITGLDETAINKLRTDLPS